MFANGVKRQQIYRNSPFRTFLAKVKAQRVEAAQANNEQQNKEAAPLGNLYDLFSEQYYRATELKTKDNDALEMIKIISQKQPIDLQRKFDLAMR